MVSRAFIIVATTTLCSCRPTSICDRPGRATGQFVQVAGSEAFKIRMSETGLAPPHVACRAETTIPAAIMYVKLSDQKTTHDNPSMQGASYAAVPELGFAEGVYRVLGIGRGLDSDDCGQAALHACNQAVDRYYVVNRALRPVSVVCTLQDDRHLCMAPHD